MRRLNKATIFCFLLLFFFFLREALYINVYCHKRPILCSGIQFFTFFFFFLYHFFFLNFILFLNFT